MDNTLLCEVTTFSRESTLHFPDGSVQKVPTAELGQLLATTCNLSGINKVRFVCDNKNYLEGLIEESKLQESTLYGINNIEYEVI